VASWADLIEAGTDAVLEALTSQGPEATEPRQNSPFAAVLSVQERRACLVAVQEHRRAEHTA
jgi:hypothetical protein